ncbi:hypothetical protein RAC89_29000 [Paenibacillus sp. GD4]|uniref:hypothetical protein n=1 Tax=Paenibacillus sp. GD4 TaxID=3068890 RepID=UPI002796630B|nr:hypothetical protein [Paenibacillus sp. GD4]MDQ1914419.1 hypothetical protein [Paenibacillus sp. GD4]
MTTTNQTHWTLGKAAEHLQEQGMDIPVTTLRGWFNELHKHKIHTLSRNERRDRVLNERDLKIAEFIYEAKKQYGNQITMKTIGEQIAGKFDVYYVQEEEEDKFQLEVFEENRLKEFIQVAVTERVEALRQDLILEYEQKYQQQLALMPSQESLKEERMVENKTVAYNLWLTEKKLRKILEDEALERWKANPIKTGFLIKKEDPYRKLEFIQKYIDEQLPQRLKEALE